MLALIREEQFEASAKDDLDIEKEVEEKWFDHHLRELDSEGYCFGHGVVSVVPVVHFECFDVEVALFDCCLGTEILTQQHPTL